ncbi:methyltransferase domain-containing protein [Candidatus Saccharibacteria bacterium]|nr:methyltransferase domain-containing protein [Candidatus Saccharibacteria bacterium]
MQYLAILGRQPKISLAELESLFTEVSVVAGSNNLLATFESETAPDISRLGGTIKLAEPLYECEFKKSLATFLVGYANKNDFSSKFVIGVSDYSKGATARKTQGEALRLKRDLKKVGFNMRVLPNKEAVLSSAAVFHNQLGEKPGHFEFIKFNDCWFVGLGVQNIKAYAERDQARPARDAKNGMLPPKLAQILVNLCGPLEPGARILDPFCGTGVVLQEALLMGYRAYGTDISERIVGFARKNLKWLNRGDFELSVGDAQDFKWKGPIDAVAFEGYLGPPMSQPPAEIKMKQVKEELTPLYHNVLRNLSNQLQSGTPVVMAIPAWLRPDGHYSHLKILDVIDELGYNVVKYKDLSQKDLLYYRDGQVVAREIIVLRKK